MVFKNSDEVIKPQYVIQKLHEITGGDAFITSDVGQHQMWAAQYYKFNQPRRWINSGGLGTMGFGLPAAMGVQLAHPGATVKIVWTHSWFDPAKEKKAAESLKAAGADVLGQNVDSPSTGQYAKTVSVPWVGYDSNAQSFAPTQWPSRAILPRMRRSVWFGGPIGRIRTTMPSRMTASWSISSPKSRRMRGRAS